MTTTTSLQHVFMGARWGFKDGKGGYLWRCSCGDSSQTVAKSKEDAHRRWESGLNRYRPNHRKYLKSLRDR